MTLASSSTFLCHNLLLRKIGVIIVSASGEKEEKVRGQGSQVLVAHNNGLKIFLIKLLISEPALGHCDSADLGGSPGICILLSPRCSRVGSWPGHQTGETAVNP